MREKNLFIVEDDPIFGSFLEYTLRKHTEYNVFRYMTGKECIENLHRNPSAMTLDYSLPDMNGGEILRKVKEILPDIKVLMVSGNGDIATAVKLIKDGAYDYFEKNSVNDVKVKVLEALNEIKKAN